MRRGVVGQCRRHCRARRAAARPVCGSGSRYRGTVSPDRRAHCGGSSRCDQCGSPSQATRVSVTPCLVLGRRSPPGPTGMFAAALVFVVVGAMWSAVFPLPAEQPIIWVLIGCAFTVGFGVPITVGVAFSPSLRPIRDLAEGTERVAAGDFSQRLPVVQDDDLGALAASFNRMQAGLAERQRLQARSARTWIRFWRRDYWSRATICSPVSAAR